MGRLAARGPIVAVATVAWERSLDGGVLGARAHAEVFLQVALVDAVRGVKRARDPDIGAVVALLEVVSAEVMPSDDGKAAVTRLLGQV